MRASDSHPQFKPKVREYTNFAFRGIQRVCKETGPRPCGSEEEKRAQDYMLREYNTCADAAQIEEFETHPAAHMGFTRVEAVLLLCAVALNWNWFGTHLFALIPICLALIVYIGEYALCRPVVDFLFPKKTSRNCIAVRKPSGEVKRRIILSGHIDSSYEWRPLYLGGKSLVGVVAAYAWVGFLYLAVYAVLGYLYGGKDYDFIAVMNWISLAFAPAGVILFFFVSGKTVSPGANKGLTGVFCSAAVMKYMADHDLRLEHTELVCLSVGAEEAGLGGVRAYLNAHAAQLKSDGVETVFIATDAVKELEGQTVYTRDGMAGLDGRACALLQKAGALSDVSLHTGKFDGGATSASAVSRAGIPAAAYGAKGAGLPKYYRTRLDTWEELDRRTVEKGVEILINAAYLFDEQGLKENYD